MIQAKKNNQAGFSLIETVIYVGALAILVVVLSDLALGLVKNYRLVRVKESLALSADQVSGAFWRETRNASLIYLPTTVFDSDYGELSLTTDFQPTGGGEPTTYTDIYRAENRVWLKKEGGTPQALTSPSAEVTRFKLVRSSGAGGKEGARFYLDLKAADYPNETFSVTGFAVLRGGYVQE